jgi:hypothetical protein
MAERLAKELNGRNDEGRSLSFGAYLTQGFLFVAGAGFEPATFGL